MKKKHTWIGIGALISGFLLGVFSISLRGLVEQIQIGDVLSIVYGFFLFIGLVSLLLSLYYLKESRKSHTLYQTVDEEEMNERAYVMTYRYLGYGTVASNVLMISVLFCLVLVVSPVLENVYLFICTMILFIFAFATTAYCLQTTYLIRQYKLSIFATPKEVLAYLDSYDEGEKQAEMGNGYLILFRLNQILLPSLYIVLMVLSVILQETQLVALLLLVVVHLYINIEQLRKTKRYFK